MRVAIGAVAGTRGGPATYAVELVRALVETQPHSHFTVLTDEPEAFGDVADTRRIPLGSSWRQPLWDHLGIARALRAESFDVYHGTKGVLPRGVRTPAVVTIHDLAVRVLPATFRMAQRVHLGVETPFAVRRARAILTDSRSTARDLERMYRRSRGKIEVVPLAARSDIRPALDEEIRAWRKARGIDGLAIGYLGTVQPRKNLELLVDAFRRAAGGRRWQLLVAGRIRPGYRPDFFSTGDGRIRYLGELADEEVPAYLGALACMVSPSSYEGFGLTFIEAMAAGCPVIGFANSSIPEVVGDAGVLVAREEAAPLADAIELVATDPEYATRLARKGVARAALFTWQETARKTHAVYARVVEAARKGGRR